MNFILRLKHWQVFLTLIAGIFLSNFKVENNQTLSIILLLVGMMIYFSWVLFVGHGLYQVLPSKIEMNYNLFLINSFVWLISYSSIMIISDGEGMTFTGLAALPGFYVIYALLHFLMFPVRALKSIEKGKKAEIGECIWDFVLVAILPIGIWFLQPRINSVITKSEQEIE